MDFQERQKLVRRITSGKFYTTIDYHYTSYDILFTEPSLDILTQSDWVYTKFYNKAKNNGGMTINDTYDLLKKDGKWSDKQDEDMITLEKDIEALQLQLTQNKYNKTAQRAIKATIEVKESKRRDLYRTKHQLIPFSIENMSEIARQSFIISKIAQVEPEELLNSQKFLETLRVYYFEENGISESQIREIARTDPWRLYWTSSRDTGTSLFPHSAVEFTSPQYLLVTWSKIYDFAYQSTPRPTDDIIKDDVRFDAWYKDQVKKQEQELAKSSIEEFIEGKGDQIFIPADSEGAKEIYEMNSPQARAAIREKQQALEKAGELNEVDMPDVKRQIAMELNSIRPK